MDSLKQSYPSFSSWQTPDIVKQARKAADAGDIETLSYCLAALSPKHREDALTAYLDVNEYAKKLDIEPVDWLERAAEVTQGFVPKTKGEHNLYIILLHELKGKVPGYGLYVGETSKSPTDRFQEHAERKRSRKGPLFSRIVFKHCKCLLPSLYDHLNPLSRAEAKELEGKIAEALRLAGIPVFGGH